VSIAPRIATRITAPALLVRVIAVIVAACTLLALVVSVSQAQTRHSGAWHLRKWNIGKAVSVMRKIHPGPTHANPIHPPPAKPSKPVKPVKPSPPNQGPQPRYQDLQATYGFSGPLSDQWGVYDSSWSGDPYSRVPSLVSVSDGMLHVATDNRSGSGLCMCVNGGNPTKAYGRWDIRARASKNSDHGFAVMLWPVAEDWPAGGEIDIAEFPSADRNRVEFTLHYGANNSRILQGFPGDFTKFHTYSVEWTPSYIRYWIDGKVLTTVTDPAAIPDRPMHLALQAGANTDNPSNTSSVLDVAWIKAYR
jgi:Glycosyl hydrolases family 16